MTEKDDILRFEPEWMFLDTKKLTGSPLPGAVRLFFGIHMRSRMFKILMKANRPRRKENTLTQFPWDSILKLTITKKVPVPEITMVLNEEKCNHVLCIVGAEEKVFEKIYEVFNVIFFYLMNKRFKMNCAEICKTIRVLCELEIPYNENENVLDTSEQDSVATLEDLIQAEAQSLLTEDKTVSENKMQLEAEPNRGIDLYQILNVPSIVAIVFTLLINLIYFLFFNQEA